MPLLTFRETEPLISIIVWRSNPQEGLEERRSELVREGWPLHSAELVTRWQLAYRLAWVAAMAGRESTVGVKVTLAEVKRYMGRFGDDAHKRI